MENCAYTEKGDVRQIPKRVRGLEKEKTVKSKTIEHTHVLDLVFTSLD